MIHIIYCLIIFVLFIVIVFQSKTIEFHRKEKIETRETIRKLKSRLRDVLNDYRRDRGVATITLAEFKEYEDPTLIPSIPLDTPVRSRTIIRPFGIEPKRRPARTDVSSSRVNSSQATSNTYSNPSSSYYSGDSGSSSSSDSSSSCDSGSSSSSSCD